MDVGGISNKADISAAAEAAVAKTAKPTASRKSKQVEKKSVKSKFREYEVQEGFCGLKAGSVIKRDSTNKSVQNSVKKGYLNEK